MDDGKCMVAVCVQQSQLYEHGTAFSSFVVHFYVKLSRLILPVARECYCYGSGVRQRFQAAHQAFNGT